MHERQLKPEALLISASLSYITLSGLHDSLSASLYIPFPIFIGCLFVRVEAPGDIIEWSIIMVNWQFCHFFLQETKGAQ